MSVSQTLRLGNHYASNRQWNNATEAYINAIKQLYGSVGPSESLPLEPGLLKALRKLDDHTVPEHELGPALRQLRDEHTKQSGQALGPFMSGFWLHHLNIFTVVYHDRRVISEDIELDGVPFALPHGVPVAFALFTDNDKMSSALLSAAQRTQLSYAFSHLAMTGVTIAIGLYTVGKVLDCTGIPTINKRARNYHWALLLKPDSAWTLAHFGEVYRNIANGWPPTRSQMSTPDSRVKDYVRALLYFAEAIRLRPDEFWAQAHFGAAIVNVRAFVGAAHPQIPLLAALLNHWFPEADNKDMALLDKAMASLTTSQRLRGNFYPWAQLYAADVLLIKSVIMKDHANVHALGTLGLAMTLDAMYLQPQMAGELFEPAELYDNAFYQISLLSLATQRYHMAWQYARIGHSREFKFRFIHGLQSLLGYQILANISDQYIHREAPESTTDTSIFDHHAHGLGAPLKPSVPIPPAPIGHPGELIEFIGGIVKWVCVPTVTPFLDESAPIDTNIRISLIQVCFILVNFQHILQGLSADGIPEEVNKRCGTILDNMNTLSTHIQDRVKLRLDDRKRALYPRDNHFDDMCAHLHVGHLSYNMASMLEPHSSE